MAVEKLATPNLNADLARMKGVEDHMEAQGGMVTLHAGIAEMVVTQLKIVK